MNEPKEIEIHLEHQLLRGLEWGNRGQFPVIGLHGWLDNAATFNHLAPLLNNINLVSLDFPGHGLSSHKPENTIFHMVELVIDTIKAADALGFERFAILGHSLGAAVGSLVAGALRERITACIFLDGLGPMTTPAKDSPGQLRLFLSDSDSFSSKSPPRYDSPERAIQARQRVGNMSMDSVRTLTSRGLKSHDENEWRWRSDPRLLLPTPMQMTEEQTLAFLQDITADVLLIRPEPGYPFSQEMMEKRLSAIKQLQIEKVKGHHHVHLDDPQCVQSLISDFFAKHS